MLILNPGANKMTKKFFKESIKSIIKMEMRWLAYLLITLIIILSFTSIYVAIRLQMKSAHPIP